MVSVFILREERMSEHTCAREGGAEGERESHAAPVLSAEPDVDLSLPTKEPLPEPKSRMGHSATTQVLRRDFWEKFLL